MKALQKENRIKNILTPLP